MKQYTTEELWQALEVLENAAQHLAESTGEFDWTKSHSEAYHILSDLASKVFSCVSRREQ